MHIQTSSEYPARTADYIDRGAEMVSRLGGLVAFATALVAIFYLAF